MTRIKTVLKNGLTVISEHTEHSVSTMLTYWTKVGGDYEKNFPFGIAHFLEHMMFKGTEERTKEDIKEEIDAIGGSFNASTWGDKTRYYTVVPFDKWETGVTVLSDMMFNSIFPEEEVKREKGVVLEEIKRYEDEPSGHAFNVLYEEMMKNRPERQSVLGTPDSVSSISRDDLLSFVDAFYQPKNMVFVATGNINHEALCSLLETLTPSTSKEVDTSIEPFEPFSLGGKTITIEREIKQAHLRFGLFGPNAHEEDSYILDVIGTLLGGSMSSRFFKIIREEKGLAYTANCGYMKGNDLGFLLGYVGTDKEKLSEVKEIIVKELNRLKTEPVSSKELEKVKNLKTGRYLVSQDYKEYINLHLAVQHMYGIGDSPVQYADKIKKVTSDDILRVANTYFGEDKMLFVEVVPKK